MNIVKIVRKSFPKKENLLFLMNFLIQVILFIELKRNSLIYRNSYQGKINFIKYMLIIKFINNFSIMVEIPCLLSIEF